MSSTATPKPSLYRSLFNPFLHIAGGTALLAGWTAMLLASIVSYFSKAHFDGAIDIHFGAGGKYGIFLMEQFIAWTSVTAVFYIIGIAFSKSKIRLIDVAGTLAMARLTTLPAALIGFLPVYPVKLDDPMLALTIIITLIPGIWMIALLYNAFVVSTNIRGAKATGWFIAGLLTAELLSKVLLQYLIPLV